MTAKKEDAYPLREHYYRQDNVKGQATERWSMLCGVLGLAQDRAEEAGLKEVAAVLSTLKFRVEAAYEHFIKHFDKAFFFDHNTILSVEEEYDPEYADLFDLYKWSCK